MGSTAGPTLPEDHPLRGIVTSAVRAVAALDGGGDTLTAGDAIGALASLRDAVELQLRELIDFARDNGATWGDIAGLLRVTPQAAHKRYGPKGAALRAPTLIEGVASTPRPATG
jgi:hypothetical protein